MFKIFFLIILTISIKISLSQSEKNVTEVSETIFEYIYQVYSGMANASDLSESESQCTQVLIKNKKNFIDNLIPIVGSFGNNKELYNAIIKNGLNILTIHGFAKNCKILNIIILYNSLTIEKNVKSLGKKLIELATTINDIIGEKITTKDFFNKIGILANTIFDLIVK